MARLELEVGTDVLLLETGDALLLEIILQQQAVGGGSVAIAGALTSVPTFSQAVGSGSIAIAGTLGRVTKISVGAGSIAIAGALSAESVRTSLVPGLELEHGTGVLLLETGDALLLESLLQQAVGGGSIAISGALSTTVVELFTQAVGSGSVAISGSLDRLFKFGVDRLELEHGTGVLLLETGDALLLELPFYLVTVGSGSVAISGSLDGLLKVAVVGKRGLGLTLQNRSLSLNVGNRIFSLTLPRRK